MSEECCQNNRLMGLFPGQGSQLVGMGFSFYQDYPVARQVFEEVSDAIGFNVATLCFEGPIEALSVTTVLQPCLLATSLAAYRVFEQELGLVLDAVAGHSLGEFSALVAAGAFSLYQAAKWVHIRAQAMQDAAPLGQGGMLVVLGPSQEIVEGWCFDATQKAQKNRSQGYQGAGIALQALVLPANMNAPDQTVVAGSQDALDCFLEIQKEHAASVRSKAMFLPVTAPFHSPLVASAKEILLENFGEYVAPALKFRYIPNVLGVFSETQKTVMSLLAEQVAQPVLWAKTMRTAYEHDYGSFIEFAPGKVLSGLVKKNYTVLDAGRVFKTCAFGSTEDMVGVIESLKDFL